VTGPGDGAGLIEPVPVVSSQLLSEKALSNFGLVIDATASRTVHEAVELTRRDGRSSWPALVTVAISQRAVTGIAAVTPRGAVGAGIDLLRRLAIASSSDPELADVRDDFFPPP
jgi:hypothetical protein